MSATARFFDPLLSAAERGFLADVRAFLERSLDSALVAAEDAQRSLVADFERGNAWAERLSPRRWQAGHWPASAGGAGLTPMENFLLQYESGLRGAPLLPAPGLSYVGPVVIAFGTEAQKAEFLPRILDGRDQWCQGFSEPGSGSDLASVAMFAERRGDVFRLNGSKIWTTYAHLANRIFLLVRTRREPTRDALSFMLLDMDMPGIEVRPIRLLTGDHEFNQVFFDDVEVPPECLLGAEGDGWKIAKALLEMERGSFVFGGRVRRRLELLGARARAARALPAGFTEAFTAIELDLAAYECTELRLAHRGDARGEAFAAASVVKIEWTEIAQRIDALALALAGAGALRVDQAGEHRADGGMAMPGWLASYFNNRAASIYAGTNEVQRNLVFRAMRRGLDAGAAGAGPALDERQAEERAALADSARRVVDERYEAASANARGQLAAFDPGRWRALAELGWLAGALDDAHDGLDLAPSLLSALAEAFGPAVAPEPLASQLAYGGGLLARLSAAPAHRDLVADWASGACLLALAHAERDDAWPSEAGLDTLASATDGGFVISGTKRAVIDGGLADTLLVSTRVPGARAGCAVFLVRASADGVHVDAGTTVDGRNLAEVRLENVQVGPDAALRQVDDPRRILDEAQTLFALLLASESLGIVRACTRGTHTYLSEREQFGIKLADMQALQHRLVDMQLAVLRLESQLERARLVADTEGLAAATAPVAAATRLAAGVSRHVAHEAIQLHGAVGMTDELAIGRCVRRLTANEVLAGTARADRELTRARGATGGR